MGNFQKLPKAEALKAPGGVKVLDGDRHHVRFGAYVFSMHTYSIDLQRRNDLFKVTSREKAELGFTLRHVGPYDK